MIDMEISRFETIFERCAATESSISSEISLVSLEMVFCKAVSGKTARWVKYRHLAGTNCVLSRLEAMDRRFLYV